MNPRLTAFLAIAALALGACATPNRPGAPGTAQLVDARSGRVVVAPLNLVVRTPVELEGQGEHAWAELLHYFLDRGQRVAVIEPASADAVWRAATSGIDLSDRAVALERARARFAQILAEHHDYDVLVVPSLVLRPARVQGPYASWDGVRRTVPGAADVIDPAVASLMDPPGAVWVNGMSGDVPAASLHVALLDAEGRTAFQGLGGLDLAREPRRDTRKGMERWTWEPRSEPLADAAHLREGIALAVGGALEQALPTLKTAQRP